MLGNQAQFKRFQKNIEDPNFSRSPHWFDKETMAFFDTTVMTGVLPGPGHLFVTRDMTFDRQHAYTVREFVVEPVDVGRGRIEERAVEVKTIGDFNEFQTLDEAVNAALESV